MKRLPTELAGHLNEALFDWKYYKIKIYAQRGARTHDPEI